MKATNTIHRTREKDVNYRTKLVSLETESFLDNSFLEGSLK